ncbi:MAG: DegV family protein [Anaerolineae bacterium]|jgi:DegV family protein with EDD domain
MQPVRIVTDSTCDVPAELAERLKVTVVPAYVQMEGQSLRDRDQISRADFYRRLPHLSEVPTTATPPAHEFTVAFRELIGQAEEVVAILLSESLSGMYNVARLGAQEVPELKIHLVDSRQVAMGSGWQVITAAEAAAAGQAAPEILAQLKDVRPRIRILTMLDTLEYLRRSGRVAFARAAAARLLRIKPLIEVYEGEVVLLGRVRTRRAAIDRLVEMVDELGPLDRLAVVHTAADDVESFRDRLGRSFPVERILVSHVGPVVGAHVGPGALGVAAIIAA